MRKYLVEYIAEVSKKENETEKREALIKAVNISLALEKIACKVSMYRRILSIKEVSLDFKIKTMKIINGYALVEIIKKEKVTESGVIIPGEMLVHDEGIVLDVDPKVSHIVKVGDKVKFSQHSGHEIEHEGKNCKFLRVYDKDSPRTDIIGVYGKD